MNKTRSYTQLHTTASYFLFIGAIASILNTMEFFSFGEVPSDVFLINYPYFILKGLQLIGIWIGSLLFIVYLLLLLFSLINKKKL